MTDETRTDDPHPIGKSSLYERVSSISRGERPSPLAAAREHLGSVADLIPEQTVIEPRGEQLVSLADSGMAEPARGSVEQAMIAGADPVTGELPREEAERAPPPAAETASVSNAVHEEITPQPAAPSPPPPERQTFNSAPPPPAQPTPEPEPQEIEIAVDGLPAPMAATNLGYLLNSLENGQLSADIIGAMAALGQGMTEIADSTGKRQKGKINITLNLSTEGEAFFIEADFKVTAPKLPRPRTLAFQDDGGNFTRSQPKQKVFFGVRDAGGGPRQIRDATKR